MFVRVGNIQLHGKQFGEGQDLLMIHGLGGAWMDWSENIPAFSDRYRVTALDCRGHGDSDKPQGPYTLPMMCQDILAFMDAAGIERAHFMGLSMGGMLSQHLALMAPGRVRSLTLVNTASNLRPLDWTFRLRKALRVIMFPLIGMEGIGRIVAKSLFPDPEQREHYDYVVNRWARADHHGFLSAARAVASHDLLDRLGEIRAPTLVITGDSDVTLPIYYSHQLAKGIPGAQYRVIPFSRHATPIDQRDLFNQTARAFLDSVSG